MELSEEKIIKAKKYNSKLFPVYKMFAWDLLFYYSISFLFLTQVKGLTASEILFAESFYPLFKLVFQIPSINIIELIGRRKSLILGNILIALSIIILIVTKGINAVILYNLILGFGYSIKNTSEPALLNDCVSFKEKPRAVFSSIDGKGSAYWYFFDAITSICCGFLYVFNNYLPIILCLVCSIISCILSYKLLPYENNNIKESYDENKSFKVYFKNLEIAFKNILSSSRLKALILFSGVFAGILAIRSTMASSLLSEINVSEESFGIIFAALTCISGIASKYQNLFHKKLRNKVLAAFSMTFSISMIITGLTVIIAGDSAFSFIVVLVGYSMQYAIRGPYYTLQKRYLNSFATQSMSTKIYSACFLIENIFGTVTYWLASIALGMMSTSYAIVIIGCIFTIAFVFILDYMKDKIGLKPEEYKKSDINLTEVH